MKGQLRAYRYIFIDWHGTLSDSLFWANRPAFARLSASLFSPGGEHCSLLDPWMRGVLTSEQVVEAVTSAIGGDYQGALAQLAASCREMRVSSAALAAIAALRRQGRRAVIATDNMDTFRRWTVPSLGLANLFDAILCSSEIGARKCDINCCGRSSFFQPFLDQEGIGPGESVLLDDSAAAGAIAEDLGIAHVQIGAPADLPAALRRLGMEPPPAGHQARLISRPAVQQSRHERSTDLPG